MFVSALGLQYDTYVRSRMQAKHCFSSFSFSAGFSSFSREQLRSAEKPNQLTSLLHSPSSSSGCSSSHSRLSSSYSQPFSAFTASTSLLGLDSRISLITKKQRDENQNVGRGLSNRPTSVPLFASFLVLLDPESDPFEAVSSHSGFNYAPNS